MKCRSDKVMSGKAGPLIEWLGTGWNDRAGDWKTLMEAGMGDTLLVQLGGSWNHKVVAS